MSARAALGQLLAALALVFRTHAAAWRFRRFRSRKCECKEPTPSREACHCVELAAEFVVWRRGRWEPVCYYCVLAAEKPVDLYPPGVS